MCHWRPSPIQPLRSDRVREAFRKTFASRNTHELPTILPDPPKDWETPYASLARNETLEWQSLTTVTAAAKAFVDYVLGSEEGTWNPLNRTWSKHETTPSDGQTESPGSVIGANYRPQNHLARGH